jgi:hypothetical protein
MRPPEEPELQKANGRWAKKASWVVIQSLVTVELKKQKTACRVQTTIRQMVAYVLSSVWTCLVRTEAARALLIHGCSCLEHDQFMATVMAMIVAFGNDRCARSFASPWQWIV